MKLDDQTLKKILSNIYDAGRYEESSDCIDEAEQAILGLVLSARPEKQHEGFGMEHSILNRRIGYNSCIDDYTAALKEKLE